MNLGGGPRAEALRRAGLLACAGALACFALISGGCVYSSAITEVVHAQDEAYDIDPDAEPIYVNAVDGEMTSDEVPSLVPLTEGVREYLEGLPQFEGSLADAEVRESLEGIDEFMSRVEASRSGSKWDAGDGQESDSRDSSGKKASDRSWLDGVAPRSRDVAVSHVASARPAESGVQSNSGDPNGGSGNSGAALSGAGSSGRAAEGGGAASGSANAGAGGEDPNAQSAVGRNPGSTFSDVGSLVDVPDGVRTVAAVGNAAVVCAALGGADGDPNLVAADADLLSGNAARALANRSISTAAVAWAGHGAAAGQADVATLMRLAPDAVVVSEGESTLAEAEVAALTSAGTHVVYVPAMTSPQRASLCVQRIGQMLGRGGDSTAQGLAERYAALVDEFSDYASGGISAYTVYVSDWVTTAAYHGSRSDVAVNGVAFAPAGSASQPLGTFLRAAGVSNTASDKIPYTTVSAPAVVWPFVGGTNDPDWSGVVAVNGGLWTTDNGYGLALTRISPHNNYETYNLGDAGFPVMLARNAAVRDAIVADRINGGVYSSGHADTSIVSDAYRVCVNPHGLFASWIDGSMESVLEIPWAYKEIRCAGADGGRCENVVRDFYATFYGIDEVDYTAIEGGTYAG